MKYEYSESVAKKLEVLEKYLRIKKYAVDTIRQTKNYTSIYLSWLEEKGMDAEQVNYALFSTFVFQLKERESSSMIRRIVLAVRHYYDSIEIDKNPASGIYIRDRRSSIVNSVMGYSELVELYESYQVLDDRDRRNKVILGLLIYQGISTSVLQFIELNHVQIKGSKIYIPGQGNTNSRSLNIVANQLLDLQEYIEEVRPRMLLNVAKKRPGRKPKRINPIISQRLFFSERGSERLKNSVYHLFRSLKKLNPKVSSGRVIRSTVLSEWLKYKDVRVVQYMAGHRWVSSTERYDLGDLENLKSSLGKYHPLK